MTKHESTNNTLTLFVIGTPTALLKRSWQAIVKFGSCGVLGESKIDPIIFCMGSHDWGFVFAGHVLDLVAKNRISPARNRMNLK